MDRMEVPEGLEDMPPEAQLPVYEQLAKAMKEAMGSLAPNKPTKGQEGKLEWSREIKYLLRLQHRNPKQFFRRVKSSSLMSMQRSNPPCSQTSYQH